MVLFAASLNGDWQTSTVPRSAIIMHAVPRQQTLAHVARVSGRGYWTGTPVTLTFLPAPSGTGIVFRRVDLRTRPSIPALASHRVDTSLRTRLECGSATVEMVEHVMAALYGLQIDNCIVECDSAEMPGLDGSALGIALALYHAGIQRQDAPASVLTVDTLLEVGDESSNVVAIPSRQPQLNLSYHLDYGPSSPIPASSTTLSMTPKEFLEQVAPARTFLSERDAAELQKLGLATHVTYRDLLVFGDTGPIDNTLHFSDECSRHKLLDLLGDLALCGARLHGTIQARRSGHNLNGRMAEQLMLRLRAQQPSFQRAA